MSGFTPNFQLEFLAPGQPAYETRDVLERMARSIDAALTRGPASPPNAQDLAAVAGRVATLETAPAVSLIGQNVNAPNMLSAAWTRVLLTIVEEGPPEALSGGGLLISRPGVYRVTAMGGVTGNPTGRRGCRISRAPAGGGAEESRAHWQGLAAATASGTAIVAGPSLLLRCATGDRLYVDLLQDSGVTLASRPDLTMLTADWRRA